MKFFRKWKKDEDGMIVVEALLTFTLFAAVCLAIIFMINIFMVHNRIQFAINSAGQELAAYTYLYDAFKLRDAEQTVKNDGKEYTKPIDDQAAQLAKTLNSFADVGDAFGEVKSNAKGQWDSVKSLDFDSVSFDSLSESIDKATGSIGTAVDETGSFISGVGDLFSDPGALMGGIIYMAADGISYAAKSWLGKAMAESLTEKYLSFGSDNDGADGYLKSMGIVDGYSGLDFSGTTIFCDDDNRMIDINVEYEVDFGFINPFLPVKSVRLKQRASIAAWVGGDGEVVEINRGEDEGEGDD